MNMNVRKTNTGKLLVAILALAMVISGCVIVFGEEANAEGNVAKIGDNEYSTLEEAVAEATEGQTIELIQDTTVTTTINIINSVKIDAKTFTITLSDDANITSTDKTGTIVADGSVSKAVIASYGTSITISDISISISSQTKGELRPIINWNSFDDSKNLKVIRATFNADDNSRVGGNFSALSLNNYQEKGTAFIEDCHFNGGMIGVSAGCKIDIKTTDDVVLNFYGTTGTFDLSRMLTIDNPTVLKTIIGWAGSPGGATGKSNITVNVDKTLDLGQLVAGAGVQNTDSEKLNVNIKENATAYGGEGIDTLTIDSEKTFTVTPGKSYNGDKITGPGNLVSKGATVNSNITVTGNVTMDGIALGNDLIAIQDDVLTISGNAYLTENLTIPSDKTLMLVSGSTLEMNGHTITIQNSGSLVVEYGASIKSNTGNEVIYLDRSASISNQGTIGYGVNPVTVQVLNDSDASYVGKGSVSMQNVSGVVFSVVNSGTPESQKPVYILTVSGSINVEDDEQNDHELTIRNARIIDEMTIGQGVTLNTEAGKKVFIVGNATLTVDGTMDAQGLVMQNGSTVNINGKVTGEITAQTGDYAVNDTPSLKNTTIELKATDFNLVGLTLTIGQVTYIDDSTDPATTMVSQRLYLSGNVTGVYTGTDDEVPALSNAEIAISNPEGGKSYIAADTVLSLGTGIKMTGAGTVVLGQIQYVDSSLVASGFVGTQYRVDSTGANGAKTTTYYIETFEAAYGNIANAYQTTITVYGGVDINIDVDLQAKQRIVINGTSTIAEENTVIVRSQGSITQISDVQGVLIKYNGGNCPEPAKYVVEKKGDGYTSWSGLVPAINGAQPGDVIDVKMGGDVKSSMTIPEGVTVRIASGVILKFEKDLTVDEGAKIENDGTIDMKGAKSKVNVYGELDSSEGTITFSATIIGDAVDTRALNSTGTTVLGQTNYGTLENKINGAAYLNNDQCMVITTLPKAIEGVAGTDAISKVVIILGNVSDKTDVTLAADMSLLVQGPATLGTITLSIADDGTQGSIVASTGKLTATVTGSTGTADAPVDSSVDLSAAKNLGIGLMANTSSANVRTVYMIVSDGSDDQESPAYFEGYMTVASGKVNVGVMVIDGEKTSLTVASGATLAVEKFGQVDPDMTVGSSGTGYRNPALVVDGTLLIDVEGFVIDSYSYIVDEMENTTASRQNIAVNGTLTIADEASLAVDDMTVTGSVDVSTTEDKEAVLTVNKVLVVGQKPTTLGAAGVVSGAVSLTNGAYIKAYPGSDLSGALIDVDVATGESGAESTQFYINDFLYMTVYAVSGVNYSAVLGAEVFDLPGYEVSNAGKVSIEENGKTTYYWFTDVDLTKGANDSAIGTDEALYFKAVSSTVDVKVSVGPGISLYIDNIRMVSGESVKLTVGTHTVTAAVDPGYEGTIQIMFNGQAVTGSFTITADMASAAYEGDVTVTATGDISVAGGSATTGGDDGLGLTDILLIILVVLIVVMAIMVALRLMRS